MIENKKIVEWIFKLSKGISRILYIMQEYYKQWVRGIAREIRKVSGELKDNILKIWRRIQIGKVERKLSVELGFSQSC